MDAMKKWREKLDMKELLFHIFDGDLGFSGPVYKRLSYKKNNENVVNLNFAIIISV